MFFRFQLHRSKLIKSRQSKPTHNGEIGVDIQPPNEVPFGKFRKKSQNLYQLVYAYYSKFVAIKSANLTVYDNLL